MAVSSKLFPNPMKFSFLPLLVTAVALGGEGHAHGPQPGAVPTGPVVMGPEARRNLALETVPAEVRQLADEAVLRGIVGPSTGALAMVAPSTPARVLELRALPGQLLASGDAIAVIQPLISGAGKVVLTAPLAGNLIGTLPRPGLVLAAGQPVAEIADLARLAVRGRVMSRPLPPLKPNQNVSVRIGDRVLRGKVLSAGPSIDSPLPALDFEVMLEGALSEDFGAVALLGVRTGVPEPAIAVPFSAVVGQPGREAVFVESEPGRFERRTVALGRREAGWVEVVRGVLPSERVVTRGAYQLQFAGAAPAPADAHGHGH